MSTDNSLLGFGVEPQEVDAVLESLVGERNEDILAWYGYLSSRQALLQAVVDRIRDMRRSTVLDLYEDMDNGTFAQVADRLNVSRATAQQMIERGRALAESAEQGDS